MSDDLATTTSDTPAETPPGAPDAVEQEARAECAAALEQLCDLLDRAMAEPEADVLRAHIESCDPCSDAADAEEAVRVLIRRACLTSAPATLRLRIVTQLLSRGA